MKRITVALLLLLCLGCATSKKYEANLDLYKGQPFNLVKLYWGAPTSSYTVGDLEMYVYSQTGATVATGNRNFAMAQTFWCETTFIVRDGIVRSWKWRGNACKS